MLSLILRLPTEVLRIFLEGVTMVAHRKLLSGWVIGRGHS